MNTEKARLKLKKNQIIQRSNGIRFVIIPPELPLHGQEVYDAVMEIGGDRGPLVTIHAGNGSESGRVHVHLEFMDALVELQKDLQFQGQLIRLPQTFEN